MIKQTKIARGLQMVRAESDPPSADVAGFVAQLNTALDQFKAKHTAEVDSVRQAVEKSREARPRYVRPTLYFRL